MTNAQFAGLVEQYQRLVYTVCYQLVQDHQLAEDLTQDTFVSAFTHMDSCPPEHYKPWLARIATNKARSFVSYSRLYVAANWISRIWKMPIWLFICVRS